jgi:2-polyprenyl-6-methoxyphenol hydroxylase-like FAD-dependent oxidoreductase
MLSPNALRTLDNVGLYERLRDKALEFGKLYFQNDKDETTDTYYFGSKSIYGCQAIRIMRKELLSKLLTMLRERSIPVHFDSVLATIDDGTNNKVAFSFTNGQAALASLMIGADGIHSTVRHQI